MGLLTERINNKLEKGNLINEHARNHEPVPLRRILTDGVTKITLGECNK